MLTRQFEKAREKMHTLYAGQPARLAALQQLLEKEMEVLSATMHQWSQLQAQKLDAARKQLATQWENSDARHRLQALENALREQRARVSRLHLQAA